MKLLPQPQKLTMQEGNFCTNYTTTIVIDMTCGKNAFVYAQQIKDTIQKWCGLEVAIVRGKAQQGDIVLKQGETLVDGKPSYRLAICENGIPEKRNPMAFSFLLSVRRESSPWM